jgi:hypothetical protein
VTSVTHSTAVVRRAGRNLLGVVLVAALAFAVTPAHGEEEFVPGSGWAKAEFLRVGPKTAGLNSGLIAGQTLADYQNAVARAQSRAIDTTIYGTSLTANGCDGGNPSLHHDDLPTTVRVDSREPGSEEGHTEYWPILPRDLPYQFADLKEENGGAPNADPGPDSPARADFTRLFAKADTSPSSFSTSDNATAYVVGVGEATGGRTVTSTSLEGRTRRSESVVEIPEVRLAGGAVVFHDLRWRAVQTSGPGAPRDTKFDTAFRLGGVEIGGATYTLPDEADAAFQAQARALLRVINAALEPSGLVVDLPMGRQENGHAIVSPLSIRVDRPSLGREAFALLPKEVYDARAAIIQEILDRDCRPSSFVALADISLATFAGSGATVVEFGGVDAFTDGTRYVDPFDFTPPDPPDLPDVPATSHGDAPIARPQQSATPARVLSETVTADGAAADSDTAALPADVYATGGIAPLGETFLPGSKSGTAAIVGIIGLLAVLGIATLDFLRPRRLAAMASRVEVPAEEPG